MHTVYAKTQVSDQSAVCLVHLVLELGASLRVHLVLELGASLCVHLVSA